jgi:PAS domain S-box-containing protein
MSTTNPSEEHQVSVLIADDNSNNLKVISGMLERKGYRVRIAYNGEQALKSLELAPVDIILLDVHMPKMDGYEACRRLKQDDRFSSIPVLFVSALNESFNKVKAFEYGAADYITKPVDMDELIARVKTHYNLYIMRTQLEKMIGERTVELKDREKLLEHVLNNSPDTIYILDCTTQKPLFLNKSEFCGYAKAELESTTILQDAIHPDDALRYTEYRNSILERLEDGIQPIEFRMKNSEGEWEWIHCRENILTRQSNGHPTQMLMTLSIITEFKHMQEQITQSQKMEAIGHLAGGIAHDFNNILSAIIGYTDMVLEELPKGGILAHNLQQVLKAGDRARHLVAQILTFSRQSEDIKEPLYIRPILKEVTELLKASLPSSIELKIDLAKDTASIEANATKIHEILMNLCTNAAYAMKEKGVLEIRHEEQQIGKTLQGNTGIIKPGFYSVVIVRDSGCGIPAAHQNKIFEPYFTTKPKGEGTGLGLAVTTGIIQSYNGGILLFSEPGKGTEFRIFLPKSAEDVEEKTDDDSAIKGGTEHLMFIDDEESIGDMMKVVLKRLGYDVTVFTDSQPALETFQKTPQAFDCVITDQTMPEISGYELAQQMLKIRGDIPIILCTGYSKTVSRKNVLNAGIRELCIKPLRIADIARLIRTVLKKTGGESSHPPDMPVIQSG